ncbi:glucose-6-phosphate isomerase [Alphaproteobacteria bacterium]|nr:glucose-6-phosphate isomerase [Alphaproteobacteria bacterium]
MAIKLDDEYIKNFISNDELRRFAPLVEAAHELTHNGQGAGGDQTGWVDLPVDYDRDELARIKAAAKKIGEQADILIVIGVGGSYIGSRAVIELAKSQDYNFTPQGTPRIFYAGNNLSSVKLDSIIKMCEGKDLALNVISKSGTTLEPALAFRILRDIMYKKYGRDEANRRIYVTTNPDGGALKDLADHEDLETFSVPNSMGGRFSVLSSVGLLPIAVAGIDVDELLAGAAAARDDTLDPSIDKNQANRYVAIRNILYQKGFTNEMIVGYEPAFSKMAEWWKQLFGESEGKNHGGLIPQSVTYTTDLHSLGQYLQEGRRDIIETVVDFTTSHETIKVEKDPENLDGLNFLAGKTLDEINHAAMLGTLQAHVDSGVPNLLLRVPTTTPYEIGYLIYFFEKACAVSGYVAGVNPFDQPGVEAYKKNMFKLLGKE